MKPPTTNDERETAGDPFLLLYAIRMKDTRALGTNCSPCEGDRRGVTRKTAVGQETTDDD
jgi:hypothetical protein